MHAYDVNWTDADRLRKVCSVLAGRVILDPARQPHVQLGRPWTTSFVKPAGSGDDTRGIKHASA